MTKHNHAPARHRVAVEVALIRKMLHARRPFHSRGEQPAEVTVYVELGRPIKGPNLLLILLESKRCVSGWAEQRPLLFRRQPDKAEYPRLDGPT
jgi:hypothetical protein